MYQTITQQEKTNRIQKMSRFLTNSYFLHKTFETQNQNDASHFIPSVSAGQITSHAKSPRLHATSSLDLFETIETLKVKLHLYNNKKIKKCSPTSYRRNFFTEKLDFKCKKVHCFVKILTLSFDLPAAANFSGGRDGTTPNFCGG